jgi:putrescine transport system permease protein
MAQHHVTWKIRIAVLFPAYGWLLLFTLIPFILILGISVSTLVESVPPYRLFTGIDALTGQWYMQPSLGSYSLIINDSLYVAAFINSLFYALAATILALMIAYPIAYGIARSKQLWIRQCLLVMVIIPFWTSLLIRVYAWMLLLKDNGLVNQFLLYINFIDQPISWLAHPGTVIIGITYAYLPFMVLPLYAALEKIPPEYREAAADLGATPWRAWWRITLPLSVPGIIAGSILVMIPAVGEVVIPELLGGSNILMIGKVIWTEFFSNRDWPVAASITVCITFGLVIPVVIGQWLLARSSAQQNQGR